MMQSLQALFRSRKTIAVLLAVAAATVLCAMGKIPTDEFIKFTGALTAVLVGSIAAEDSAAKRNPNRGDERDEFQ